MWAGFCLRSRGLRGGGRAGGVWCTRTWRVGDPRKRVVGGYAYPVGLTPCLGIVYAVFKRVAACLCGERGALRPDYLRLWAAWADAMGGACLLGRERAGAVARLPRAANRRWCGRCELCRCGVCRACALCSWGRARAVQAVAGRSGERVWGWRAPAGRTYAWRVQSETGDRGWLSPGGAYILDAPASRDMVGCARSPRRGPCGYEGELSVKRVSEWV